MKMLWFAVFLTIWKINLALNSYLSNRVRLGWKEGISDFWLKSRAYWFFVLVIPLNWEEKIFFQQVLDLHNNHISTLPADIGELKSLQVHVVELLLFCISRDSWGSECPQTSKRAYPVHVWGGTCEQKDRQRKIRCWLSLLCSL